MLPQYQLVLTSVISVCIIGSILAFYVYRRREKSNVLVILLMLSLLPLISLLRPGTYESGDHSSNIARTISFYHTLREGILVPQWADLNAGYGYPIFIFLYPLPYYLSSFIHFIGFSYVDSVKVLIGVAYILSGIGMYLWAKEELGKFAAFTAAVFYLYAPYHLVDMHFRISMGEVLAFAILPYCFLFMKKFISQAKLLYFSLLVLALFLQLLSNQAISLVSFAFLSCYGLCVWIQKKNRSFTDLYRTIPAFIIALLLSIYFWLPVVLESQYTHQDKYNDTLRFVRLEELLYSPWRYGFLFQGHYGELSYVVGYVQLIVIAACIFLLVKGKVKSTEKNLMLFFLGAFFLFCFLMLPVSKAVWEGLPLLNNFQFTYRLLLLVALCTSMLAAIVAKKLHKTVVIILVILAILQTILNWGNRRTIPSQNDAYFESTLQTSTIFNGFEVAVPKWIPNYANPWPSKVPLHHLEILSGNATITELKRTSITREYLINSFEPTYFKENTWYFPNWKVFANNREIPLNYENPRAPGLITFGLQPGLYEVKIVFLDTPLRSFTKTVTFVSFAGCILFLLFYTNRKVIKQFFKRHNNRRK